MNKRIALFLLLASVCVAQEKPQAAQVSIKAPVDKVSELTNPANVSHAPEWVRTEGHDDLHNESGVTFSLIDKENDAVIRVVCSKGKLISTWLHTDKVIDAQSSPLYGSAVQIEWRRDDEPKAHKVPPLPVSRDFHDIQLGFQGFLYGVGSEFKQNKKANNWGKRVVIGVPIYLSNNGVFTFDVPDPSKVNGECGIK
jgi:hypothetical protein